MITIKRDAAIGDILMVTPIVQALRKKYGEVFLQVAPSLHDKMHALLNVPGVLNVTREVHGDVIDLNNAYELRPHLHPVEAYADAAGLGLAETTRGFCRATGQHVDKKFDVLIHATVSWRNRTLPRGFWAALVNALHLHGLTVACVAQNQSEVISACDAVYQNQTLAQVAGLISFGTRVFICGDSAPLHIAASTFTPIIGLFTIATAERRRPWGRIPETFAGINAAVDCVGCLHRALRPCSFLECDYDSTDPRFQSCLNGFSIPEIVGKALNMRAAFG